MAGAAADSPQECHPVHGGQEEAQKNIREIIDLIKQRKKATKPVQDIVKGVGYQTDGKKRETKALRDNSTEGMFDKMEKKGVAQGCQGQQH